MSERKRTQFSDHASNKININFLKKTRLDIFYLQEPTLVIRINGSYIVDGLYSGKLYDYFDNN